MTMNQLTSVQNEFILLVNAYYQADATSKNMLPTSMFGKKNIQSELSLFREMLMQSSKMLSNKVIQYDQQGKAGEFDKILIAAKLREKFGVNFLFISEMEDSISKFKVKDGDMNLYRIMFQMGSDTIYSFLSEIIPQFGQDVSLMESISGLIKDMLYHNYWEGEQIIQKINYVRAMNSDLHFSDNWLIEYALRMFQK